MRKVPRVALITENRFQDAASASAANVPDAYWANIEREDSLLCQALDQRGVDSQRVSWQDGAVRWHEFDCAVMRTTWNYFTAFAQFQRWLAHVEQQVALFNSPELLRWNWDKRYLAELEQAGVQIVPSRFVEPGDAIDFRQELSTRPHGELIVKPAISGGARHTYRMTEDNREEVEQTLRSLREHETFLVQDVQRSILSRGEVSIMLFRGAFTHAVRKIAKPGDFRVQDDHGGRIVDHQPSEAELSLAQRTVASLPTDTLYARVDIVKNNEGEPALVEAELIEPELFLRNCPQAANEFAAAIVDVLH